MPRPALRLAVLTRTGPERSSLPEPEKVPVAAAHPRVASEALMAIQSDAESFPWADEEQWDICGPYRDDPGYRWVVFTAVTLLLLGAANLIEGLATVGNPQFFIHHPHPFVDNLTVWGSGTHHSNPGSLAARGWIGVIVGLVQLASGVGVLVKNQLSRATGLVVLSVHAIAQLLIMRVDPLLSAATFTLDLLALYALTRYGKKAAQTGTAIPFSRSLMQTKAFSRTVAGKLFPPSPSRSSDSNHSHGEDPPSRELIAWRRAA